MIGKKQTNIPNQKIIPPMPKPKTYKKEVKKINMLFSRSDFKFNENEVIMAGAINNNAEVLQDILKDIEELKEAIKIKSVTVNGVIETKGAAVQEEIKNDIDPDIKKLFDALKEIKNICEGQKRCDNCIFYNKFIDCCLFEEDGCLFKTPERWNI